MSLQNLKKSQNFGSNGGETTRKSNLGSVRSRKPKTKKFEQAGKEKARGEAETVQTSKQNMCRKILFFVAIMVVFAVTSSFGLRIDSIQKKTKNIGLLFDLDGTCCDTEILHSVIWSDLLETRGGLKIDMAFYKDNIAGKANMDTIKRFFPNLTISQQKELAIEKEKLFREKVKKEGMSVVKGFKEFMEYISLGGKWSLADVDGSEIKLVPVIVTNSPGENYALMLESMGYKAGAAHPSSSLHPFPPFLDVFTYEQRDCRGKPHADPYAFAARDNGLKTENSIAFEDSSSGIKSARNAHVKAIVGIATTQSEKNLLELGATIGVADWTVLQSRYSSPLELLKNLVGF